MAVIIIIVIMESLPYFAYFVNFPYTEVVFKYAVLYSNLHA